MKSKTENDEPVEKIYWSIGEVAKRVNHVPSKIRYWMEFFKLKTAVNGKGNRLFTLVDIDKIETINYLIEVEKYTLEGVKQRMNTPVNLFDRLNAYAGKYTFNFQMWGEGQYSIYVQKDGIDLWDCGGEQTAEIAMAKTLEYLDRINRK